jgi:hypothetical protein
MRVITTDQTVRKINRKMKKKGYETKKSKMSKLVIVYFIPNTNIRIMFAFKKKIDQFKLAN